MTISEKAAYLKGLMDGMELDTEKPEGKMIAAIVDLLGDMTKRMADIEETTIAISDELDEIEEDLDAIEDYILSEDEDDFDDDEDDFEDFEDEDDEEFDFCCDDDEEEEEEEGMTYTAKCTSCGTTIEFGELDIDLGFIICPKCAERMEFTYLSDDDEEE